MTYANTTKKNQKLIIQRVRELVNGLKATSDLKFQFANLNNRLRDKLADFLTQHGQSLNSAGDRLFPSISADWLDNFASFEMNTALTSGVYFAAPVRKVWDRSAGSFGFELTIKPKSAIQPLLASLSTTKRPITHVKYDAILIQVIGNRIAVKQQRLRELDITAWPEAPAPIPFTLTGENTGGETMAVVLVSATAYFRKATTGTVPGDLVMAPFKATNALLIANLDGTIGQND